MDRAERHPRARPLARVRRPRRDADPRRPRRGRDQGRGTRPRRRGAPFRHHAGHAGAAQVGEPFVSRAQPQQAQHHDRPRIPGRPSCRAPDGQRLRRRRSQLPPRRDDEVRTRVREPAYRATGRDLLRVLFVRPDRTVVAHRRERLGTPGAQRHDEHHRRARPAAGPMRDFDRRSPREPRAGHRDPRRAVPSRAHRRGPGGRNVAVAQLGAPDELFLRRVLGARRDPRPHGHGESPLGAEPGVSRCGRRRRHHRAVRRHVEADGRSTRSFARPAGMAHDRGPAASSRRDHRGDQRDHAHACEATS